MNASVDLAIVIMLVWCGYFVTGTAFLLHIAFYQRGFDDAHKPAEAPPAP